MQNLFFAAFWLRRKAAMNLDMLAVIRLQGIVCGTYLNYLYTIDPCKSFHNVVHIVLA